MKLKGLIDTVSISLNASDAEKYNKICHCKFNEEGFYEMLRFAVNCKKKVSAPLCPSLTSSETKKSKNAAPSQNRRASSSESGRTSKVTNNEKD